MVLFWPQPTERDLAQQVLNDRGMSLDPRYYKIALEVGSFRTANLFHRAGFSPSLALALLGQRAATDPTQRTVNVLLDHASSPLTLEQFLRLLDVSDEPDPSLLDTPIPYADDGSSVPPQFLDQHDPRSATPLDRLLMAPGLPLLGHAILQGQTDAVDSLLQLRANPTLGTLPLLLAGHRFSEDLHKLALDPFYYVHDKNSSAAGNAPEFQALLHTGLRPSKLLPPILAKSLLKHSTKISCNDFDLPLSKFRLTGYRLQRRPSSSDDEYDYVLAEFHPDTILGCPPVFQIEGNLLIAALDQRQQISRKGAIVRLLIADGTFHLGWRGALSLTAPDDGPQHYIGDFQHTHHLLAMTVRERDRLVIGGAGTGRELSSPW